MANTFHWFGHKLYSTIPSFNHYNRYTVVIQMMYILRYFVHKYVSKVSKVFTLWIFLDLMRFEQILSFDAAVWRPCIVGYNFIGNSSVLRLVFLVFGNNHLKKVKDWWTTKTNYTRLDYSKMNKKLRFPTLTVYVVHLKKFGSFTLLQDPI